MAQVQLSILKITNDDNNYVITDEEARTNSETAVETANSAQSAATNAESIANTAKSTADSKLKTVKLLSSYDEATNTLTLNLQSSIN